MTRIDLSHFATEGVRVLSGRDRGIAVRKALKLEEADRAHGAELVFVIPATIPYVNSSFFLGLIGESVQDLGREDFVRRYKIEAEPRVVDRFNQAVERVLLTTAPLP
jgi:hypothetical protein